MHDYKIIDNYVKLDKPKKNNKKITATRFATILGLNPWKTPFEAWCEITRTYEKPFEDTIYTTAGKVIEPKIIQYLKDYHFLDIKTPTEVYGKDYFKRMRGDFYPTFEVFGGMWDAKGEDIIVEIKTTKRAEDWLEGIPLYYKLQACLYAYLSGIDTVYMACAFLNEEDYEHPEQFKPTGDNMIIEAFSLKESYPYFQDGYIKLAMEWWENYVESGISPAFDEKKDADILKALRTNVIESDTELEELLTKINEEQMALDEAKATTDKIDKELKKHKEALKKYMQGKFTESDNKVEVSSSDYTFTLSKTEKPTLDTKGLEANHSDIYKQYLVNKVEYRLNVNNKKDGKKNG